MSEHPLATVSVGRGWERRFAGLEDLFEFLIANAPGRSDGADENPETFHVARR